jgi:epoxyqueuosine reductase QueG
MNNLKEFIKIEAHEEGIDLIGFAKARNFTEFEQFYNEKVENNYLSDVGNIRDIKKRLNVFEICRSENNKSCRHFF